MPDDYTVSRWCKTCNRLMFFVKTDNLKFLVDCGAFQGPEELEDRNYEPFPFNPADIDFVFLTHAHFRSLWKNTCFGKARV